MVSEPQFIRSGVNSDGEVLEKFTPQTHSVLDPRVAFLVDSLLKDVLNRGTGAAVRAHGFTLPAAGKTGTSREDRKSTRLNSSHGYISYAVFCLNKDGRFDPEAISHHSNQATSHAFAASLPAGGSESFSSLNPLDPRTNLRTRSTDSDSAVGGRL